MAEVFAASEIMDKLTILSDAAKYDVACTSSGTDRGGDGKISEMPLPVVYVILLQEMADVFPCLKFYLPMSAFMIVNIASTARQMMYREYHLRLMKSVS